MEEKTTDKRENIVKILLERGIFISPDFMNFLNDNHIADHVYDFISKKGDDVDLEMLTQEILRISMNDDKEAGGCDFLKDDGESIIACKGREGDADKKIGDEHTDNDVVIKFSYDDEPQKKSVKDFIDYFRARFDRMENILREKSELSNIVSISRLNSKKDRENVSLIGMVRDKEMTKNGNIMITLEDKTDTIKVLVNKSKKDMFNIAKDIVFDEMIGVVGVNGDRIIFADSIIFPEIPSTKELKKAPYEGYAVFISDLHIGSKDYLDSNFNKFLKWLNGEAGSEGQKEIANKVTHIFIIGDLVDGVGIYPKQEKDLLIEDIYEQYDACAEQLEKIPKDIKVIICPGNHDAMRLAEPQPPIYKDFAERMYALPNVTFVSNPSLVNFGAKEGFGGFDVLMYHGYSFDYYISNVESIRNNDGYKRPDLMMKFLLKKRHLAPTYTSTLFVPTPDDDHLIIKEVPDFFVTGHIHYCPILLQKHINHNGVTLISGSCWQSTTDFQIKLGHTPDSAKVPVVNLNTREVKIFNFDKV